MVSPLFIANNRCRSASEGISRLSDKVCRQVFFSYFLSDLYSLLLRYIMATASPILRIMLSVSGTYEDGKEIG
mgnify:FL=1